MAKDEERKTLRESRAIVRKALKNGDLTEKELIKFIRQRRERGRTFHHPTINDKGARKNGQHGQLSFDHFK